MPFGPLGLLPLDKLVQPELLGLAVQSCTLALPFLWV